MARAFDLPTLIAGIRGSQARLETTIARLDATSLGQPSRLPGWSRAHLLSHIARNAEAMSRMLEGVRMGEVPDQYPGGAAGREADINAGATKPVDQVLDDVIESAQVLDKAIDAMTPEAWDRPVRFLAIGEQPAGRVVWSRWRELEIHHADLDIGYRAADWPAAFIGQYLSGELRRLESRIPPGLQIEVRCEGYEGRYGPQNAPLLTLAGEPWAVFAWLIGRTTEAETNLRAEFNGSPTPPIRLGAWA